MRSRRAYGGRGGRGGRDDAWDARDAGFDETPTFFTDGSRAAAPVRATERGGVSFDDGCVENTARPATRAPGLPSSGGRSSRSVRRGGGRSSTREARVRGSKRLTGAHLAGARGPGLGRWRGDVRAAEREIRRGGRWPPGDATRGTAPERDARRPARPPGRLGGRRTRDDDETMETSLRRGGGRLDPGGPEDELRTRRRGPGAARALRPGGTGRGDVQVRGRRPRAHGHAEPDGADEYNFAGSRFGSSARRASRRRWRRWASSGQPHPGADVQGARGGL